MKKILYPGVIALTVYLNIMYEWPAGIKILSAELAFPFICVGFLFFVKRKISVKIILHKDMAEQREELPVRIKVENDSFLPAVVKVPFTCRYLLDKKIKKTSYKVYVEGRKHTIVDSSLTAESCGRLQFTVGKLRVYDCWNFFSLSRRCRENQSMIIMPKTYPVNLTVSSRTKWFPIDGESYARDRSGDDSAEIYEVREYRAGDRMQKVHWKLSAKEDELYIKEFSYPLGAAVVILLEEGNKGAKRMEKGNLFVESVLSVSMALLEKECAHYIVWKKRREEEMQRVLIKDEEDFYAFLLQLLEFEKGCLESDMEERYRYEYRNETCSTLMKISTDLFLQINKQERMDMMEHGAETFFETVDMIV